MRVPEMGAGSGSVGRALGRAMYARGGKGAIVNTNCHPGVLRNLGTEYRKKLSEVGKGVSIACHALDWSAFPGMINPACVRSRMQVGIS